MQCRSGKKKPERKPVSSDQPLPKEPDPKAQPVATSTELRNTNNAKTVSSVPSFSLKDALNGETKSNHPATATTSQRMGEPEPEKYENKPFTQEQLNEAWLKYAETLKTDDPRMFSTLTAKIPVLIDNTTIELTVNNFLQEEAVVKIKPQTIKFLRQELENNTIELITNTKEPENTQKFYNDKEKFECMSQKNPNLLKFKQQFGLDFG